MLTALLAGPAFGQQVVDYTRGEAGPDKLPLGYPVPQPVESLTPLDGFRRYDSLHAGHQALALEHDFIAAHNVGNTIRGADIFAYTLSDPDDVTPRGYPEPAFQITGGIHAREWQSPEAVTGIIERFAERRHDGGLYQYLVDNTNLVVIPVLNIDGFRQTQRYPSRVILGTDPSNPNSAPRDGRMRRKNMRGVDTRLLTFDDHLGGIDLNRNNPPYAPSVQASGNPNSLVYHGAGAHTEPETRALRDATQLAPANRLRLYTDFHSFGQAFLDPLTGNQRQNGIQARLINLARANLSAQGTSYSRDPAPTQFGGIGSTDEFFAHRHQVPAWTLEIEPRLSAGGTQYGGFGATHDGFILPDSQIARVRDELANAYALLFYTQAGPPSVSAVRVLDEAGNIVWGGEWHRTGPGTREFTQTANGSLVPGNEYRLWLAFDKPMRHRDGQGRLANYAGTGGDIHPVIRFAGSTQEIAIIAREGRWLSAPDAPNAPGFVHYRDDAYVAPFEVPGTLEPGEGEMLTINIDAEDLARNALDADPSTVADWRAGHWIGYESADGVERDFGGVDSTLSVSLTAEPLDELRLETLDVDAVEGSLRAIDLTREGTGEGRVTALVSTSLVVSDTLARWTRHQVVWEEGETGTRTFQVPVPDDLVVNDDFAFFLGVVGGIESVDGPASRSDEVFSIHVLDNDSEAGARVNLLNVAGPAELTDPAGGEPVQTDESQRLGHALCRSIREASARERNIEINLRDRAIYELSQVTCGTTGRTAVTVPAQRVSITGHDSVVRLAENAVGTERLIEVGPAATLEIEGLILEGGRLSGNVNGAGVLNRGSFSARDVIFRNHSANRGGAFANYGSASLANTRFVGNDSRQGGGALHNDGELTLIGVTLSGNSSDGQGGGLLNTGTLEIADSTVSGNTSPEGSAIASKGGATVAGSIVDGDCFAAPGALDSTGYNLVTGEGCAFSGAGDIEAANAGLEPIDADDLLHPAGDSPAVDAGKPTGCVASDAAGTPRPFAEACDIGAAERGLSVHRGLWFNPGRSGHGIDLQQARDTLIVTWFTYGPGGFPVWYQASAPFTGPTWRADLIRFTFDAGSGEATGEVVGTVGLMFDSAASATLEWDLSPIGGGAGSEPFEPLISDEAAPAFDTTGIWAAADGSDWGLTVDSQGTVNIATVYYYDSEGNPRWVQGAGQGGLGTVMALNSFTGFCPGCSMQAMPVSLFQVGTLELRFLARRRGIVESDFVYPGTEGGEWRRQVELGPLSDPVP